MLLNSPYYIVIFLPLVVGIYFFIEKNHHASLGHVWLVAVSLFFYSYSNPKSLILLTCSIVVNFIFGNILFHYRGNDFSGNSKIHQTKARYLFVLSLLFNIFLLAYFKYTNFFIQNLNTAFGYRIMKLEVILPLAISFFTFQQISYLVDIYRGQIQKDNLLNYFLFVTFFPQLVIGPIVRYKEVIPQFIDKNNVPPDWENIARGIFVISVGLFKKLIIADKFGQWANSGFDTTNALTFFDAWSASLSYTFQIYYDFSGYTDMAIGAALLFNIKIPINFNSPYQALNIQDFWHRWHITLSRWLRDYLYIPLGGNRKGNIRTYINLFITFLIAGIWHGAGWTFIVWGAMHGIALAVNRLWRQLKFKMPKLLGWFFTFMFLNITWIFFRASTCEDALRIMKGLIKINTAGFSDKFAQIVNYLNPWSFYKLLPKEDGMLPQIQTLEYLIVFGLIAFLLPNTMQMIQFVKNDGKLIFKPTFKYAAIAACLMYKALMTFAGSSTVPKDFLYFNF